MTSFFPQQLELNDPLTPAAPRTIADTGLDPIFLGDLALKLTCTVPHLTTQWAAGQLRLPPALVETILWQLKQEQLVEILGQNGEFGYRYAATQRGRDYAKGLMAVCGYVGPAPVSLAAYTAMLDQQMAQRCKPTLQQVRQATAAMVLPEEAVEVAALSAISGRSLFLFGPPGNGKSTLGRLLHEVVKGDLWIPHCINIESNIIRIFDPLLHRPAEMPETTESIDQRWMRIRPPLVVAGGEMTLNELDLAYNPALRFYEAPPHLKANGGTLIIDDFGRQRVDPHELLNRWIIPLEHQIDHLTLCTGQKIEVPFRLMLIVATNLNVADVADPAFLRRMGYRLLLDRPSPEDYARIFQQYAEGIGLTVPVELLTRLLQRYREEKRELRASEPRDLIERARDICRLRLHPIELNEDVMDLAWIAYFGQSAPM